jgi:hypothetical protein
VYQTDRVWLVAWWAAMLAGCGAAELGVEPEELAVRDLLGVAPEVALRWSQAERAGARALLRSALGQQREVAPLEVTLPGGRPLAADLLAAVVRGDEERAARGVAPLLISRGRVERRHVVYAAPGAGDAGSPPGGQSQAASGARSPGGEPAGRSSVGPGPGQLHLEAQLPPALPDRDPAVPTVVAAAPGTDSGAGLVAKHRATVRLLARAAGCPDPVEVVAAPQTPLVALCLAQQRLVLINPLVLALVEPGPEAPIATTRRHVAPGQETGAAGSLRPAGRGQTRAAVTGNPYNFFGSLGECAAAQRLRCEQCTASGSCRPEGDGGDGAAECTALAADGGRGYFLFCANLALAIATVSGCVREAVPSCAQATGAGNQLGELTANQEFVDDARCAEGLDVCLERLYGGSRTDYPPPPSPDAGMPDPDPAEPPPAPRDLSVGCTDSSSGCEFSPQCSADGSGGSCDPDCDADCGGCGGCGGSDSDGGDSGGSAGGDSGCSSGCGSGDDGGGGDTGGGGGCGGGGDSGGSGGGGDCGGGDCGGGDCGGGDCGGGDCGGDCGQCAVRAPRRPVRGGAALAWALMPVIVLLRWRCREMRRRDRAAGEGDAR